MKKGLMTTLACLALVFSVTGCGSNEGTVRTIREVLQYDNVTGLFVLDGEKVTIKNAVVNGQHGDTLTIALQTTYTTVEVVQKKADPDIKIRTTVDVTGTVETYHGRCRIVDATVTTVDDTRLAVYVTGGMTTFSQFDSFGRTASGVLATDVPLQIVSFNGITEFKEGVDSILTVCYQGDEDPNDYIDFIVWGDTDEQTLNYLNAYFFGNNTGSVVTWDDPFNYADSHSEIPATWTGLGEKSVIKGLYHFFYDEELDSFGMGPMFYIDNICIPSLEGYELYDEESALTTLFDNLASAYESGDDGASYSAHITYKTLEGTEIDSSETTGWVTSGDNLSPEFEDYLALGTTETEDNCWVRACPSRFEVLWRDASLTSGDYDYLNQVWVDWTDEDEEQWTDLYYFYTEDAYNTFISSIAEGGYQGEYTPTDNNAEFVYTYEGTWYYYYLTLYDMAYYDTSFHDNGQVTRDINGEQLTGTQFLVNDSNVVHDLWDCLAGNGWGTTYTWEDEDLTLPTLEDIFYVKGEEDGNDFFRATYARDTGWYYNTTSHPTGDVVFWASFTWYCDVTIGDNTIGNTVTAEKD
ncbi:MAG: hypothetical protein LUD22_00595 [Coprobacillus sp.]|nr:hypothetical protein [Coprobacillus sp.]